MFVLVRSKQQANAPILCPNLPLKYPPSSIKMNTNPAASLWKHCWGPVYHWESLVHCKDFRRNATVQFYDVHSNTKLYQDEPPGGLNYCARCASGQRYDCLFFHPTVADIFLDIVKALGKTKLGSIEDMTNLDFLDRVYRVLPAHFTQLGFPCHLGGIWRCIVDKLHQTFPLGVLKMLDVASFLQCDNFNAIEQVYECDVLSSDDSGDDEEEEGIQRQVVTPFSTTRSTPSTVSLSVLQVVPLNAARKKPLVVKKKNQMFPPKRGRMHCK